MEDRHGARNPARRRGGRIRFSGQPAAYVYTIYKKAGEAPTGSALSNRIGEAKVHLQECQAKLDQFNQETRNKGKRFTAPPPSAEGDVSESPTGSVTFPVSAVLPPELLATDPQPSVRISAKEKKANAFREAKQKADQLRREVFQMDLFGTVVVGAHFGAMPFLEMFDGLALHHTMLDKADALAADTLGTENVERGDFVYLAPTFFVYEYNTGALPDAKSHSDCGPGVAHTGSAAR